MKLRTRNIIVRNLQRKIRIEVADLERFARRAVRLCLKQPRENKTELQELSEISVLIVSDRKIAALHRTFMNDPGPTDVITFQHGEIFISADMARRNARRFRSSLAGELRLYIVHGLLHLHGFDDRTDASAREMANIQGTILTQAML